MAKMKEVLVGWCVLMALVSLVLPTSGQGCSENLVGKVSFSTSNLVCSAYTVGSSQFYVWALRDNATQATSIVVAVPLTTGNWAGLGFSSEGLMVGSTAVIATLNSSGAAATVYNLKGKSPSLVTPGSGLSFVNSSGAEAYYDSTSGYVYMSYQVDLATSTPANAGYLIMAHGAQDSGTTLQQHTDYISEPGNFVTGAAAGPSAVSKLNKKIKVHGSLNIIGWGVLLPIGAMVARYARGFDPAWFYSHIAFQILGYGCIIAGVATGVDVAKLAQPDQLNAHRGLGIFLLALATLQVLAVVLRPKKDAKVRKYWNWYHHWVGRLALFLAVVNIFVGLHMSDAEHGFKVGYISILSIEIGAFVILEFLLWLRWYKKRTSHPAAQEDPEFQFGGNV